MESQPIKLPGRRVEFSKPEGKEHYEATFELKNESEMEVAYKIRKHSTIKYIITPYIETIKPVTSPEKPQLQDNFLIESVFVTDDTPIAELFAKGKAEASKQSPRESKEHFKAYFKASISGEDIVASSPPRSDNPTKVSDAVSSEEEEKKEEKKKEEEKKEEEKADEKEEKAIETDEKTDEKDKPVVTEEKVEEKLLDDTKENNSDEKKEEADEKKEEVVIEEKSETSVSEIRQRRETGETKKQEEELRKDEAEEKPKDEDKKEKASDDKVGVPATNHENLCYIFVGLFTLICVFFVLFKK